MYCDAEGRYVPTPRNLFPGYFNPAPLSPGTEVSPAERRAELGPAGDVAPERFTAEGTIRSAGARKGRRAGSKGRARATKKR